MKLIADSGSTKTDWVIIDKNERHFIKTIGLNPYFIKKEEFIQIVSENFTPFKSNITEIYFYGSGCGSEQKKNEIKEWLSFEFGKIIIEVESDLLGAARALCKNKKGIAGILGTGSHACLFDGKKIIEEAVSLGYILGDEGGGAHMGKQLLTAFLYHELPEDIHEKFKKEFNIDKSVVLENIYKKPFPNQYLASFISFLANHKSQKFIASMVENSIELYIKRHIEKITDYNLYECNFVGSIAFIFESVLRRKAETHGLKIGEIMNKPIDGLVTYHQ